MFDWARKWCRNFCHPLAKEFQLKKFSLSHQPIDGFAKSQWQKRSRSLCWLIYRWLLAAFFTAVVYDTMIKLFYDGRWFIYLTSWGFFLCMLTSVYGAILVSLYYWRPHEFAAHPIALKIYWVFNWTTLVLATVITLVYWSLLYPFDNQSGWAVYNCWAHGFNSILMILDNMLVAFPVRILHFVYPMGLGVTYGIFTVVYYYAGGVDPFGNRYIYEILDWSNTGGASLTLFGCILVAFVFCFIHFGFYKLRTFIYNKRQSSKLTLNA